MSSSARGRREFAGPILLCLGFFLLAVAWVFSNPPGAAPDEPEHYIRALSVGRLQILGYPAEVLLVRGQDARQLVFVHEITRMVSVPPDLAAPDSWFCTVVDHSASAACLGRAGAASHPRTQVTYVGAYEPYTYVPMGLASLLGTNPVSGLLWERLANLVVSMAFITTAVLLLWEPRGRTSMVGLLLAVSPMVIFTSAVVSPSGAEVSSSLCLAAAVVRLWRSRQSRFAITSGGISAFVLAIGRPLGPVWLVCAAGLLYVLLQRDGVRQLWKLNRRALLVVIATSLAGVLLNVAWQLAAMPLGSRSLAEIGSFIIPSVGALPETFGEAIGVFGWLDTLMPRLAYGLWGLALVALLAWALLRGRRNEVRVLEGVVLCVGIITVGVSAVVVMPTGFANQGRYMLPALMVVPLLAGEIAHRNRRRASPGSLGALVIGLGCVSAGMQFIGWYTNAHRYAVGVTGPWLFFVNPQWSPPLGWAVWLVLAMAGASCIAVSMVATPPHHLTP